MPFRRGAGVIHMRELPRSLAQRCPTTDVDGRASRRNEFALEMLRFPYRQVFGDPANEPDAPLRDVFRPKVSFALLEERFRAVIQP